MFNHCGNNFGHKSWTNVLDKRTGVVLSVGRDCATQPGPTYMKKNCKGTLAMKWVSNKKWTRMEPRFSLIHTIILAFCFKFRDHFLWTAFGNDKTDLRNEIRKKTRRRKSRKLNGISIYLYHNPWTLFTPGKFYTSHPLQFFFYTRHFLHHTPATPYNFYNKQIFQEPFAPETFCTVDTKHLLHQAPCTTFTPVTLEHFLHQTSFTTDNFTTNNFYTKRPLHQAPFTPETFCTKQLLH